LINLNNDTAAVVLFSFLFGQENIYIVVLYIVENRVMEIFGVLFFSRLIILGFTENSLKSNGLKMTQL